MSWNVEKMIVEIVNLKDDVNEVLDVYNQDLKLGKHVEIFPGDFFISTSPKGNYYAVIILLSINEKNNLINYLQYTYDNGVEIFEFESQLLYGKHSYTLWVWRHKTELISEYTYNDLNKGFWHFRA